MFPFADVSAAEGEDLTARIARAYEMLAASVAGDNDDNDDDDNNNDDNNGEGHDEEEKHGMVECLLYLQRQEKVGFSRRSFTDLTGNRGKAALLAGVVFDFAKLTSVESNPEAEAAARKLLRDNLTGQQVVVCEGSFLSADWLDSDVVFFDACSLGELDELLITDRVVKICQRLLPGTYVVICSRWPTLPPHQHLVTVYETRIEDLACGEVRHAWVLRR